MLVSWVIILELRRIRMEILDTIKTNARENHNINKIDKSSETVAVQILGKTPNETR
jgi:hypothetical protein